jgi:hypothetical protein
MSNKWIHYSSQSAESYADKTGSEYIFRRYMTLKGSKVSSRLDRYFNILDLIYDPEFEKFDNILYLDIDVLVNPMADNIFDKVTDHIDVVAASEYSYKPNEYLENEEIFKKHGSDASRIYIDFCSRIASEVVTTDQMGGSIKKAQIGHVIVSVGKTLEQKEHNLATLTLLKSRIGKDGVVFSNCTFNNEFIIIDTDTQNTLLGLKEEKTAEKTNRQREAYLRRQQLNGGQQPNNA